MLNLVCTEMAVTDVGKKRISEEINKQRNSN